MNRWTLVLTLAPVLITAASCDNSADLGRPPDAPVALDSGIPDRAIDDSRESGDSSKPDRLSSLPDSKPEQKPDMTSKDKGVPSPDTTSSCDGKTFTVALTIPLPAEYVTAGFYAEGEQLVFYATGNPAHIYRHYIMDVLSGNMTIHDDEALYVSTEQPAVSIARHSWMDATSRLVTFKSAPTTYKVLEGSDANLSDVTSNLPATLGAGDSLTSANPWTSTSYSLARVGGDVYERSDLATVWSPVAALGSAGTSAWHGLAVRRMASGERVFFTQATITASGSSGLVEQDWPNSLPSSAKTAVLVSSATDLVPVGVSLDGCELYASRKTSSGLSLVVLRR